METATAPRLPRPCQSGEKGSGHNLGGWRWQAPRLNDGVCGFSKSSFRLRIARRGGEKQLCDKTEMVQNQY